MIQYIKKEEFLRLKTVPDFSRKSKEQAKEPETPGQIQEEINRLSNLMVHLIEYQAKPVLEEVEANYDFGVHFTNKGRTRIMTPKKKALLINLIQEVQFKLNYLNSIK